MTTKSVFIKLDVVIVLLNDYGGEDEVNVADDPHFYWPNLGCLYRVWESAARKQCWINLL